MEMIVIYVYATVATLSAEVYYVCVCAGERKREARLKPLSMKKKCFCFLI